MESYSHNSDTNTFNGYTCPCCNQWIPNGTWHSCYPTTPPQQPQITYQYYKVDTETLNRLLEKLDSLIELLKEAQGKS